MTAPYFTPRRRPVAPTLPTHDGMGRPITWTRTPGIGITSTTVPLPSELPQLRRQCHRCFAGLAEEDRPAGLCPACQPPDPAADRRHIAELEARIASMERRILALSDQIVAVLEMKVGKK